MFPERPRSWLRSNVGPALLPLLYAPALLLGIARIIAVARAPMDARFFTGVIETLDRFEPCTSPVFAGGLLVLLRALSEVRAVTADGSCGGSCGARGSA